MRPALMSSHNEMQNFVLRPPPPPPPKKKTHRTRYTILVPTFRSGWWGWCRSFLLCSRWWASICDWWCGTSRRRGGGASRCGSGSRGLGCITTETHLTHGASIHHGDHRPIPGRIKYEILSLHWLISFQFYHLLFIIGVSCIKTKFLFKPKHLLFIKQAAYWYAKSSGNLFTDEA